MYTSHIKHPQKLTWIEFPVEHHPSIWHFMYTSEKGPPRRIKSYIGFSVGLIRTYLTIWDITFISSKLWGKFKGVLDSGKNLEIRFSEPEVLSRSTEIVVPESENLKLRRGVGNKSQSLSPKVV